MADVRDFRKNGDVILLGHTEYKILGVEGFGGSSVVYRAAYGDQLNEGKWHQVLVKELYPYHPKGWIYRDSSGFIRCTPEAEELMECSRLRFKQGNQANLELLEKLPAQTSGNVNSYEAYGTYYSILTIHGGITLEEKLEGERPETLQECVEIMIKILNALELFHQNGMLHLDISPDNIILLPKQAMLIDYNSVWNIEDGLEGGFVFSEKEGYCAPELRLQDFSQIGYGTDLYSACAVFYQMIAGEKLSSTAVIGNPLKKLAAQKPEILEKEPKSAVHKVMEILHRGLHILARKRYQSAYEFREALCEALERLCRKGVSHSAVWESSRSLCRQTCRSDSYLFQEICLAGGEHISSEGMWGELKNGRNLLLTGPGGMGKTRMLQEIWKMGSREYRPNRPVIYYIPLKDYQEMPDEGEYIRKYFIRHLCFSEKQRDTADALHELENMFCRRLGDGVSIVLLLDGLNEAGGRRGKLLREIEYLGGMEGVSVLVTERSNEVLEYGLGSFEASRLLPLEEHVAAKSLEKAGLSMPSGQDMKELLCSPMMLGLYLQAAAIERDALLDQQPLKEIHDAKSLVGFYFDQLLMAQMRVDSGNQAMQLCHKYILQHLLPEIAYRMKQKNRSLLTFDQMYAVVKHNFRNLQLPEFGKSFPQFLGKARLMLTGIADESQWFDFAVTEQLEGRQGLIVRGENGYFGLLHDNFQEYLVEVWKENRIAYRKRRLRAWARKAAVFGAVLIVGAVGVFNIPSALDSDQYTQEEQMVIDRAVVCLETNVATLSAQIEAQRDILEEAGKKGVLEGDPREMDSLSKLITQRVAMTDTFPVLELQSDLVGELVKINPEMPVSYLQDLCQKPIVMRNVMKTALSQLEEMLCMEESIYQDAEKRKEIVEAYQSYLDACREQIFYEFDFILMYMAPDEISDILTDSRYFTSFRDYFITVSISEQDAGKIEKAVEYSRDKVKMAQDKMIGQHYKINWP